MKRKISLMTLVVLLPLARVQGQDAARDGRFAFEKALLQSVAGLPSNSVTDVLHHRGEIWLGTGKGASVSRDGDGREWQTFGHAEGLGRGSVAALAVNDTMIWVSTAFDSLTQDAGSLPTGGGLAYSRDGGTTWQLVQQPGPTPVQNVTFDIAFHDDASIWITSWGGGLQRTTDFGQTWEVIPPDSFFFDPLGRLNHRAFSVISASGVLWVGTAGGVNKSLDNGRTWTNFNHQNQAEPISGNFVVALAAQHYGGTEYIWAATVNATEPDEVRGVSVSADAGFSWHTSLHGVFAHNFAFDDSVVYVAADNGLYKSLDFGQTWAKFPEIVDAEQDITYLSDEVFAAAISANHTLWVGGPDGLATTTDEGQTWKIQRGEVPPGTEGEPRTYAYPSPFSPSRHNTLNGDGHIRFQYNTVNNTSVTVRVYNFAMELVAEVVNGKSRPANGSFFEVWDGRTDSGMQVANGVYFYSVKLAGDGTYWGKFIVMD